MKCVRFGSKGKSRERERGLKDPWADYDVPAAQRSDDRSMEAAS